MDQIQVVLDCLNLFSMCSGQKVNFQKSQVFVSQNVDTNLAHSLSQMSGIPLTNNLGKYLGVTSSMAGSPKIYLPIFLIVSRLGLQVGKLNS